MRIYEEKSLKDMEFFGGAKDRVKYLTSEELDIIEENLNELFPEGMEDTQVNDFFWFEEEFIAELLEFDSFEEIMDR